jgi:DNA-binding response OmpR family regulator
MRARYSAPHPMVKLIRLDTATRSATANGPGNHVPTILLLEDSQTVRHVLGFHLSAAGYDVLKAEDAVVAARLILDNTPDLIIADINLPYMTGVDFISALRGEQQYRDTPVIIVSSANDVAEAARKINAMAYMNKPIRIERLLEIVAICVPDVPSSGRLSSTMAPRCR